MFRFDPTTQAGLPENLNPPAANHDSIGDISKISYDAHSATYRDYMGIPFNSNDYGKWALSVNLTLTPKCTGSYGVSPGATMYGPTFDFFKLEDIYYGLEAQ